MRAPNTPRVPECGKGGLPYAPWCRPKWRQIAPGVEVLDTYGYHVIAALIHWPFAALARRLRGI